MKVSEASLHSNSRSKGNESKGKPPKQQRPSTDYKIKTECLQYVLWNIYGHDESISITYELVSWQHPNIYVMYTKRLSPSHPHPQPHAWSSPLSSTHTKVGLKHLCILWMVIYWLEKGWKDIYFIGYPGYGSVRCVFTPPTRKKKKTNKEMDTGVSTKWTRINEYVYRGMLGCNPSPQKLNSILE